MGGTVRSPGGGPQRGQWEEGLSSKASQVE